MFSFMNDGLDSFSGFDDRLHFHRVNNCFKISFILCESFVLTGFEFAHWNDDHTIFEQAFQQDQVQMLFVEIVFHVRILSGTGVMSTDFEEMSYWSDLHQTANARKNLSRQLATGNV